MGADVDLGSTLHERREQFLHGAIFEAEGIRKCHRRRGDSAAMKASERPALLLLSLADWLEPWNEERSAYRYLKAE